MRKAFSRVFSIAILTSVVIAANEPTAPPRPADVGSTHAPMKRAGNVFSGLVSRAGTTYFLTDEAAGTRTELRGTGLEKYLGKTVRIRGRVLAKETAAAGAIQVIAVVKVSAAAPASGTAGGKAAGSAGKAAAGISKGTAIGVGTAGAAGATVGGLYAAGAVGGNDAPASRP